MIAGVSLRVNFTEIESEISSYKSAFLNAPNCIICFATRNLSSLGSWDAELVACTRNIILDRICHNRSIIFGSSTADKIYDL